MEDAVLTGYRYFLFDDPRGTGKIEGYTLYLLQPLKSEGSMGYAPVTFFDRFNNRMKFPSVSADFFRQKGLAMMKANSFVQVLFDRNNKVIDLVLKES